MKWSHSAGWKNVLERQLWYVELDIFHESFLIPWMFPVFRTLGHLTAQQTVFKDSTYLQGTIPLPFDLLLYCPTPAPRHPVVGSHSSAVRCAGELSTTQKCGIHALRSEPPTNKRWHLQIQPPFLQGQTALTYSLQCPSEGKA